MVISPSASSESDPLQIPGPLAAAFGVSRVVLLKEAAHPFHHKSTRAAGSTLFRVPILEGPSIRGLRRLSEPLIALSPDGQDVAGYRFPPVFGLVPGLEGPGIPAGLKRQVTLSIPMAPGVESLNSSLAAGIVLYLWRRGVDETRPSSENGKSSMDSGSGTSRPRERLVRNHPKKY